MKKNIVYPSILVGLLILLFGFWIVLLNNYTQSRSWALPLRPTTLADTPNEFATDRYHPNSGEQIQTLTEMMKEKVTPSTDVKGLSERIVKYEKTLLEMSLTSGIYHDKLVDLIEYRNLLQFISSPYQPMDVKQLDKYLNGDYPEFHEKLGVIKKDYEQLGRALTMIGGLGEFKPHENEKYIYLSVDPSLSRDQMLQAFGLLHQYQNIPEVRTILQLQGQIQNVISTYPIIMDYNRVQSQLTNRRQLSKSDFVLAQNIRTLEDAKRYNLNIVPIPVKDNHLLSPLSPVKRMIVNGKTVLPHEYAAVGKVEVHIEPIYIPLQRTDEQPMTSSTRLVLPTQTGTSTTETSQSQQPERETPSSTSTTQQMTSSTQRP